MDVNYDRLDIEVENKLGVWGLDYDVKNKLDTEHILE